ncbi:MAG: NADPH:quinone reductase [Burkholderiaceae bacterium]
MKAAWYTKNGEAQEVLQVGELPTPEPGPGEVRVKLVSSGVNPSDVKSRRSRPITDDLIIPHSDGAGVIDAVGAGVDASRMGERVWVWNGQWQRPWGTAAQAIVLAQEQAVSLPANTDFNAAACFGIPALTAIEAVHLAGDLKGKTVLVTGASSAVGHYVSQLVVLAGGRVIGTVGSKAKAEHASQAGVAHCIFYKTEPVAQRVKELTQGRGADIIIDMDFSSTAGLITQGVLASHGTLVGYGSNVNGDIAVSWRPLLTGSINLRFFLVYDLSAEHRAYGLRRLGELLQSQQLQHSIGPVFKLDQIAAAHEVVEAGQTIGNIVLDLRS